MLIYSEWLAGCREEKIKRALKQQKRTSAASETASDRSRTDRDSAEVKPGVYTLPLAAAPERGILKKGFSHGSVGGIKTLRPSQPLLATTGPSVDSSAAAEEDENRQQLLSPTAVAVGSDVADYSGLEFIDDVDDDGCCSCSCDEDDVNTAVDGSADGPGTAEKVDCVGAGGCSVETQTDPESLTSSMASLCDPGEKMTRLCNINELLRQIDEQFNSVLLATSMTLPDVAADLSPTNSDDVRGSETEADRACLRLSPPSGTTANSQPHSSSDSKLSASESVTEPAVRPVPPLHHRLNTRPAASKTAETERTPQSIRAPLSVSCSDAAAGLASAPSTDRLLSHTAPSIPPGTSSSPATVTSEGYHTMPPPEPDLPLIIREIPKSSTTSIHFPSDSNMRPQSKRLNSPDDVDV